jgi:hypothetical protein
MTILQAIESMMTEVQRTLLVPKQKEAFLCCAKCCDANSEPKEIQQWWVGPGVGYASMCNLINAINATVVNFPGCSVENCSRPPMMQQKTIAHIMQDFQVGCFWLISSACV